MKYLTEENLKQIINLHKKDIADLQSFIQKALNEINTNITNLEAKLNNDYTNNGNEGDNNNEGNNGNEGDNNNVNKELYGFLIDQRSSTNGDPASMISYLEDCDNANYTPAYMDYDNNIFNYGDWEDAFFMNVRPCMVTFNGEVDYYLNPNDYSFKEDGTTKSDIDNVEYQGNAMIEFPRIYWKVVDNGDNTASVYISNIKEDDDFNCYSHIDINGNEIDKCYISVYPCTEHARDNDDKTYLKSMSNGMPNSSPCSYLDMREFAYNDNLLSENDIYSLLTWSDLTMINLLLLLLGKSTHIEGVFGEARTNGIHTGYKTGSLNDKGLFYGSSSKNTVKIFGIEDFYGKNYKPIDGILESDTNILVLMHQTQESRYNLNGDGYINTNAKLPNTINTASKNTHITSMSFTNYGLFPKSYGGYYSYDTADYSTSWYCADYVHSHATGQPCVLKAGGSCCSSLSFTFLGSDKLSSSTNNYFATSISLKPIKK